MERLDGGSDSEQMFDNLRYTDEWSWAAVGGWPDQLVDALAIANAAMTAC